MEELEDRQGGSGEGQHQAQAAMMEELEDRQGGSGEGQHQAKAAMMEGMGDSGEGQQQTQAAMMEETEDSLGCSMEGQHQEQAAMMEDSVEGSGKDRHQIQGATMKRHHDQESAELGIKQQNVRPGIVEKGKVIKRMVDNAASMKRDMEEVLQNIEDAVNKIGQEPAELVLSSLHDQLEAKGQKCKLPLESRDISTMEAKRQLFIRTLVHRLASSVKMVLDDSERKSDVDYVRKEVQKVRASYEGRSINSPDMDQFLSILSDLRIVAKVSHSDNYVVPAALRTSKRPHSMEIVGRTDPILVTMVSQTITNECYLPSGLFCCLISELVTVLGWTVIPLEHTHVAFTHEICISKDLSEKVHIMEHESYIKIKVESNRCLQDLSEICQRVRKMIHESIVNVYKNLYSNSSADAILNKALVWGFHCEKHPEDDTHIAAFQKENEYEFWAECLVELSSLQEVEPNQLVWFSSELDM